MVQELTLTVPLGYKEPEVLYRATPEQIAFILDAGSSAFQYLQKQQELEDHKALIASLEEKIRQEVEPAYKRAKTECEQQSQQLGLLKERVQYEQNLRLELEARIRKEEAQNREQILQEKNARILSLEQDKEKLMALEQSMRDSQRSLADTVAGLKEQFLRVSSGSSTKGKSAEVVFTDLLQRAFGSVSRHELFELENMGSAESESGDIRMVWRGIPVMWEIKNYTRTVDHKEVEKFERDMMKNPEVSLGVFISLNSLIQGHTKAGDMDVALLPDGRYCLYVNRFDQKGDAVQFLQSLQPFLEVLGSLRSKEGSKEQVETAELEKYKQTAQVICVMIQSHQTKLNDLRAMVANAKKKQDLFWAELQGKIKETEHSTKLMLHTLLKAEGENGENELTEEEELLFRDFQWATLSEAEQTFVQTVRSKFRMAESYRCPISEFKEVMKGVGLNEDVVLKLKDHLFHEEVWKRGTRDVKYLQRIV